jgi:hypothetical protein
MVNGNNIMLKIRVTNTETKAVYVHNRVPLEHVETLKMNSCLRIEVLGRSKGYDDDRRYKKDKERNN